MNCDQGKTNSTERKRRNYSDQGGKDLEVKRREVCELNHGRKIHDGHREKGREMEQEEYTHNIQSACSLFRNIFKSSKMWTALEKANPMITSSVSVCLSSS